MKSKQKSNLAVSLIMLLTAALFAANGVLAQSVVARATVGGYAEDITFINSGPLKNTMAIMANYGIYTVPIKNKNSGPFSKLCDFKHPDLNQRPTGITYIESEGLFAVNQASIPDKLFIFDQTCALTGSRTIQYLNPSYRPAHMEGLAYIPTSSPNFPDHLMAVVFDGPGLGTPRLEIMQRNGTVVSEISNPAWPSTFGNDGGLGDVTYLSPNRLLAVNYGENAFYAMDFSGNIISGPSPASGLTGMGEGVAVLGDGRIVASEYPLRLRFLDSNLNRLTESDRNDTIGINVNVPTGIAWNNDTNQLLITNSGFSASDPARVSSVPTTLDSATSVIDLSSVLLPREAVFLPAEHLTAVLGLDPTDGNSSIYLFNPNGTPNDQISLSAASLGNNYGRALTLGFLPASNEFLLSFNGTGPMGPNPQGAERRKLRVFSRTGAQGTVHDLTETGTGNIAAVEPYQESPGVDRLLVIGSFGRVFKTDLSGNSRNAGGFLFGEFNHQLKLGSRGAADFALITAGPHAGAFALIDGDNNEVVIFRL